MIAKNLVICSSFLAKARGLMFRKKSTLVNTAYLFKLKSDQKEAQRVTLHTYFVFFPILVLFLDKEKKVRYIAKLKPFTFFIYPSKVAWIIELSELKSKVNLGDQLDWKL